MFEFPYLGVDPNQIAMVTSSFAAQADLFDQFAGLESASKLDVFTSIFGLIGFTYIGVFHTAWRAIVILPWLVILIIMTLGTSYTGGNLIFTKIQPGSGQIERPGDFLNSYTSEEIDSIMASSPENEEQEIVKTYLSMGPKPADSLTDAKALQLEMFGPQIAVIHALNVMRVHVAASFAAPGHRTLSGRVSAAQAFKNARTNDFRVGYAQTQFRTVCGTGKGGGYFAVSPTQIEKAHKDIYDYWEDKEITFYDFLVLHDLFYDNQRELSGYIETSDAITGGDSSEFARFLTPPFITGDAVNDLPGKNTIWFDSPTINILESYAVASEITGNLNWVNVTTPGIVLNIVKTQSLKNQLKKFADPDDRTKKWDSFRSLVGSMPSSEAQKENFMGTPVTIMLPVLNTLGNLSNRNFWTWLNHVAQIKNCNDFHNYLFQVINDLADETTGINAAAAEFFSEGFSKCQDAGDPVCKGRSWDELTGDEQQRVALAQVKEQAARDAKRSCAKEGAIAGVADGFLSNDDELQTGGIPGIVMSGIASMFSRAVVCQSEKQATEEAKGQVHLALLSHIAGNDAVISEGILENFLATNQFRAPLRKIAKSLGEGVAPALIWVTSMFGGFAAGTYAALMPLIVTWGLSLMIVMTPFLYLMGLIIPAWSLMILATPIIGILYLKTVEITFVLIKGIFEIFKQIIESDPGTDFDTEAMYDLILGIAYTSSFALSLFLLFGLKNPAGVAQQAGSTGDKTAQIDGNVALKIAGTAAAIAAVPGKGMALAGAAKAGAGKVAATSERMGASSGFAQGLASLGGQAGRKALGESHAQHAQEEAQTDALSKLSYEDHQKRASGQTKAAEDKALAETAEANNNKNLIGSSPTGQKEHNGNVVNVEKLNNALDSLAVAAANAGGEIDEAGVVGTYGVGGKVDTKALHRDGTVAYKYNEKALNEYNAKAPEGGKINVETMIENGDAERILDKEGNKTGEIRIVEHHGYLTNKTGSPGGGSDGPSGGGGDTGGGNTPVGTDGRPLRDNVKDEQDAKERARRNEAKRQAGRQAPESNKPSGDDDNNS